MFKKSLSLLLSLTLILALTYPAAAAERGMSNFKSSKEYTGAFTDVTADAWFLDALKKCHVTGLMNGATATEFAPKGNLTLAQALVMAVRVHKTYETGNGELEKGSPWYQSALDYAVEKGMIQAEEFTDFTAPVTRGQMAYLFAKSLPAAELKAINTIAALPDVTATTTYSDAIFQLYKAGVLNGSDIYGTYKPDTTVTRAEAVSIIARVAFPEMRKNVELFQAADLTMPTAAVSANADGLATGKLGEALDTYFFDFAVKSAYTCAALNGYTPAKGNQLLVVRIVVKNTTDESIPMFDSDFQAQWGDEAEDAYAMPVQPGFISSQLPEEYELAAGATRAGVLVFEIPVSAKECSISYMEYFDDNTTGDAFFVDFTPVRK